MNLLIILPHIRYGGTERQAFYLNDSINKMESSSSMIGVLSSESVLDRPVKSVCFIKRGKFELIGSTLALYKYLTKNSYDVILSRAWTSNIPVAVCCILLNRKFSLTISGSNFEKVSFFKKIFYKYLFSNANKLVFVSSSSLEKFRRFFFIKESQVLLARNGVDINNFKRVEPNKLTKLEPIKLLFMGGLSYRKGFDTFVRSIVKLSELVPEYGYDIEITVVGDGELSNLVGDIEEVNSKFKFVHHKYSDNPNAMLTNAHIFIFPSRTEGFPNVLLEAMSSECLVISTDCETGPQEVVNNGVNGFLVPVDDHAEIARLVMHLLHNRNEIAKLSRQARQTIERAFELDTSVSNLINGLSEIQ